MRTTLTLDPDVVRLLEQEMHRRKTTLKVVVNDALRRGLTRGAPRPAKPYALRPHRTKLQPGIDPGSLNRLVDELDTEAAITRLVAHEGKARRR